MASADPSLLGTLREAKTSMYNMKAELRLSCDFPSTSFCNIGERPCPLLGNFHQTSKVGFFVPAELMSQLFAQHHTVNHLS